MLYKLINKNFKYFNKEEEYGFRTTYKIIKIIPGHFYYKMLFSPLGIIWEALETLSRPGPIES